MSNRELLLERLERLAIVLDELMPQCAELVRDTIALLKEQPEIVRCISCTFYRSDGECALHNGKWKPEGFCSWAIRKKGR